LLATAFEEGIRHFDTARMYGLGAAERELRRFVRARRGQIVIATKFGIRPTWFGAQLAVVQRPVRRLFEAFPALRRQARAHMAGPHSGRAGALVYASQRYDAHAARSSLETSLRELGTDYVDLFLLHEPQLGDVPTEEVSAYLEAARQSGHVRAWGVSGDPEPSAHVAASFAVPPHVLQIRDDIFLRSLSKLPPNMPPARVLFGVLANSLGRLVLHVTTDSDRRKRWNELVGKDCGDVETCASLLLRHALRENASGVVLFSTIKRERIRAAAAAAMSSGADDADLDAFVRLVEAELPPAAS
jgi:D-threo-aldose 1-dehydrogenase